MLTHTTLTLSLGSRRFVPDRADMALATPVRVYVNDFPGVLSKEDIVAYFVMDGQSDVETATVEDYSPV